ncbi:MAG: methionyl-tRNA formyltransferase [Acutalibacteraceae bacterium]
MKVIFMGTPDFAVPSLEALVKNGYEVSAVFTQPDKPKGRKMIMTMPPVKETAIKYNIPVFQPNKLRSPENTEIIKKINPDVIVVVAYGQILPESILKIPKYGCVNVHGSLLPKYRGAAPIQWAVIEGEEKSGVTTMLMDKGLDTGDMLLSREVKISEDETAGELFDRLSFIGGDLLIDTLSSLKKGSIVPKKQESGKSSYAKMLDKSIAKIDFSKSAREVHNLVRGLSPWPVAYTFIGGKKLKIYKTALSKKCGNPGEIVSLKPLTVACKDSSLQILEMQIEGKKRMTSKDFLMGHKMDIGTFLGE